STCSSFTHAPTTLLYSLSLHDALPISPIMPAQHSLRQPFRFAEFKNTLHITRVHDLIIDAGGIVGQHFAEESGRWKLLTVADDRSEEHTSELQSRFDLVCRLLLEKKKK